MFVGYSLTQSAYLCLDPSTSKIYTSRHVNFVESVFPFKLILVVQVQKHSLIGFHLCHFFPLRLRCSTRLQQPRPRAPDQSHCQSLINRPTSLVNRTPSEASRPILKTPSSGQPKQSNDTTNSPQNPFSPSLPLFLDPLPLNLPTNTTP